jgi:DnaJ-class molecular chaperone
MAIKNYYAILGISPTASIDEIKMAFKKLAIQWHPDKNPNRDTTSQMQEINEAYLVLKSDNRKIYDEAYHQHFGSHYKQSGSVQTPKNNTKTSVDFETVAEQYRKEATGYSKKSLSELLELLEVGGKAFKSSIIQSLIGWGILIILINLSVLMCK